MIEHRLTCPRCPEQPVTSPDAAAHTCGSCGNILEPRVGPPAHFGTLVAEGRGLPWRYPALLPVDYAPGLDDHVVPRTLRSPLLESRLGVCEAWLVDCTKFGTGTFKDLEATVVIAGALEMGLDRISVHSTGNTALAYRHYARRAGIKCAAYVPMQNHDKLVDIVPDPDYPVYLVDTGFPNVSRIAKTAALTNEWQHLAPIGWKLAGKACLAWWIYETAPQITLIVQTVAGGYGPLGYEMGFHHLRRTVDKQHGVLTGRRYLLFQPADADTLAQAWRAGAETVTADTLRLPTDPFEPTLQSTNPLATLPLLRARMPQGTMLESVAPNVIEANKPVVDEVLAEAGIRLDYNRERSAYISLAGLLAKDLGRHTKLAVVVTGSRPFHHREPAESWETLRP